MALDEFKEFISEPLVFKINGKSYTAPEIDIVKGMALSGMLNGTDASVEDKPASELWAFVLGDVWDEMIADKVPAVAAARAGMATWSDFSYGREVALSVWNSGIDPEARAALMAATQMITSDTDEASTAPKPISTSGTTSRTSKSKGRKASR